MQEAWVQFLAGEDPLEKEMEIHSSILAWRISCSGARQAIYSMELQELDRI